MQHICVIRIYGEREKDEGSCKHKAKHVANIEVVRIYGERKMRSDHACIQNMGGVRNIYIYMKRQKKEEHMDGMHAWTSMRRESN